MKLKSKNHSLFIDAYYKQGKRLIHIDSEENKNRMKLVESNQ
ncbi:MULTISPECIES: hypothetical protein [Bacillus]|uniref:Uncharacterized protein n=1 Tax=Bacillus cereus (strain G9842) TaxID=405531 RepID=B7IJF6_BACC2|nr:MULTISPECIES: hypothetical protein [Bacillus]ACK93462.1 hypothetical protein BCG9842_B2549 [Bacillus cereus G9842]AGE78836.1 hypothetical protein HD73_3258 [Bacillus thuringiensis serovar kurstaki str. HD73]AIM31391.1 hypothetical protein DF16_orf02976 [Bacillus thuringiensis serovar kurstaki str. YBT-1520]KEH45568.1 hypothetical protein BG09_5783 [Bacillus thuringiensis serovar kurstaki str. HD-1]KLA03238.1 hypothetical protein B4158_2736 [Bacillus cereus]